MLNTPNILQRLAAADREHHKEMGGALLLGSVQYACAAVLAAFILDVIVHLDSGWRLGILLALLAAFCALAGFAWHLAFVRRNRLEHIARFLESHPKVARVIYPGLASHPQADLARRQMANFSGMLAFQVADGPKLAQRFAERLEIFHYAVSLGHHRSLIFYLATDDLQANSFRLDAEHLARYRQFAGDGIFRVSVGLEDPEDLCNDLSQALETS